MMEVMRNVLRRVRGLALLLAGALALGACGQGEETRAPTPPAPPPPRAVTPGTVLTSEDMERLRKEREELVRRPTPLGEESDEVARVRDQVLRNSGLKK
jgi:hypothetical protein